MVDWPRRCIAFHLDAENMYQTCLLDNNYHGIYYIIAQPIMYHQVLHLVVPADWQRKVYGIMEMDQIGKEE